MVECGAVTRDHLLCETHDSLLHPREAAIHIYHYFAESFIYFLRPLLQQLFIPKYIHLFQGDGCGSLSFQCSSGQCVSLSDYCDYKQDCHDGSDENECGICNAP